MFEAAHSTHPPPSRPAADTPAACGSTVPWPINPPVEAAWVAWHKAHTAHLKARARKEAVYAEIEALAAAAARRKTDGVPGYLVVLYDVACLELDDARVQQAARFGAWLRSRGERTVPSAGVELGELELFPGVLGCGDV
ncbi:uncharacterized protein LOC62_02G002900 [Vanrija pseudolonga]|uniref:Uncharacterized protein n=1 Tax=Vanrija pseudolonga TaxID=143232 RepID=A0AAF1BG91_9TREE|nr:hypothetical protein LOC62_02G002900 [Vanrija pseudolonga]